MVPDVGGPAADVTEVVQVCAKVVRNPVVVLVIQSASAVRNVTVAV